MHIVSLASFLLSAFFFASSAHAQAGGIVARVIDVKGNAFVFDSRGASQRLSFGSRVYDMSDIMVDDTSYLSLLDSSGNEHHLAGGTYAKFFNRLLELKNGQIWSSAIGKTPVLLNTPNSMIVAPSGQLIVSMDNQEMKSQLLVAQGSAQIASSVEPSLKVDVPAGHFTFVDHSYENGLPRSPTRVGLHSYQKMRGVFAQVEGLKNIRVEENGVFAPAPKTAAKRGIASVESRSTGKILYVKSVQRTPASTGKRASAMDYYQDVMKKEKAPGKSSKKTAKKTPSAEVRYFGIHFSKPEAPAQEARTPASVPSSGDLVKDINSAFERSLQNQLETNQRHPDEVNQLIEELKTFRQDFSRHY